MKPEAVIYFPPFALDCTNEQLWQGSQLLPLRPKPFAILRYLAAHPHRLVTKEELLKAVWPETVVSEGLLHTYIRDLRQVLGDDPEAPRFIETVARRGYRFIGEGVRIQHSESRREEETKGWRLEAHLPSPPVSSIVGRELEFAQLHKWLDKALRGERQLVFVTGEPGIGKTTLVEAFLEQVNAPEGVWIGIGQYINGAGEAYLPVLEALGRLCRAPGSERFRELLGRQVPSWLVQMPALLGEAEFEALQRKAHGATQERMLRELAEALEVLTAERPLVLWFEDLQWSDYSTLDILSCLAQRREAARLLVIGTYRPTDVIVSGHPLKGVKQELHTRRRCVELPLGCLSDAAVAQYLAARFPGSALPHRLGPELYRRTEGNPLFLVNVVEYLVGEGWIVEGDGQWELREGGETAARSVPESLRHMIEEQMERLSPEDRRVLEVASVAGSECTAAVVAAGVQAAVEEVEERCDAVARRGHFLQEAGLARWPDGTASGRYRFLHALYQEVLSDRVAATRRVRLHRLIGERIEAGYGEKVGEIAGELALHFERGQEPWRAVQYHGQAAENAMRRSAPREAVHQVRAALALLTTLPDTRERAEQELRLQRALAAPLIATTGLAAPEVGATFTRARELCEQLGKPEQLFSVLLGLWIFQVVRGELELALSQGEQLFHLAQRGQDSTQLLQAHLALGAPSLFLGSLGSAYEHLTQGSLLYDPQPHHALVAVYGLDPGVFCQSFAAVSLCCLGFPDQARHRSEEALALARRLDHPYSTAQALTWAAEVCHSRREAAATQEYAEALIALAQAQEFPYWLGFGLLFRGLALALQGEVAVGGEQTRQGLTILRETGTVVGLRSGMILLAEVYSRGGAVEEGLAAVTEVLRTLEQPGERLWNAELYRVKGELTLQQSRVQGLASSVQKNQKSKGKSQKAKIPNTQHPTPSTYAEAEACFLKAIEIAQQQGAKLWELRAATSLARLWHGLGKRAEARHLLAEVYGWFTEGFETADLQEAKALLESLGH